MSRGTLRMILSELRSIEHDLLVGDSIRRCIALIESDLGVGSQDPKKLARRDSPDTSKQAAASVSLTRLESLVLEGISAYGERGCISDQIRADFPRLSYSSVTARFSSLLDKGLIVDTGERRKGVSTRMQRVLKASRVNTYSTGIES